MNRKHKNILRGSLILSVSLHTAALLFLQRQSVWFAPASPPAARETPWISSMETIGKDEILQEAFRAPAPSDVCSEAPIAYRPDPETSAKIVALNKERPPLELSAHSLQFLLPPDPFPADELLASTHPIAFSLPSLEGLNLFEHLPKELIVTGSPTAAPFLSPPPLHTNPRIELSSPPTPTPPEMPAQARSDLPHITNTLQAVYTSAPLLIPPPSLPQLPTLQELATISLSDSFEADLVFFPLEEGGALFALTLVPREDLKVAPIRQNYFFLIDRSNSIQKERLQITKNAVLRAIEEIGPNDTFNIIAFDSKIEKLSPVSLSANPASLMKAKSFLEGIELGSFFAHADLFKSLFLTIPYIGMEDELYTAILLTDGESLSKKGATTTLLNEWTHANDGRVSLFVVGLGGDANLPTLDAAAAFNRGKTFSSSALRGIKRKVLKAMKTVHSPIAKSLSCKAISRAPHGNVEIFPKGSQAPNLYRDEPYVILGKTDTIEDFILFVQGRLDGEWLHVKKTISLSSGKKGGDSLKAEWAQQKAYELYDEYLTQGKSECLAEARELLTPFNLKTPFE